MRPQCRRVDYDRGLSHVIATVVAIVAVDGAATELVPAVTLGHTAWPWVALGLHLCGLAWLVGLHAAHVTRPHLVTDGALLVRDGAFAEIAIRCATSSAPARSGSPVSAGRGTGSPAAWPASCTATPPWPWTWTVPNRLLITVDDHGRFVDRIRAATAAARTPRSAPPR